MQISRLHNQITVSTPINLRLTRATKTAQIQKRKRTTPPSEPAKKVLLCKYSPQWSKRGEKGVGGSGAATFAVITGKYITAELDRPWGFASLWLRVSDFNRPNP